MIKCTFEDGNKAHLRHVTVDVIVIDEKDRVLLVKRAPHMLRGNKYAIPGGFVGQNETTKEAALREFQEETGYKGEILYLFYVNDSPFRQKEDRQNVGFIYAARVVGGEVKPDEEVSAVEWFSQEELPEEDDFAFDHRTIVELFFKHRKNPFNLPLFPEQL